MADNVVVTAGSYTGVIAADDIGSGILAQRVKPVFGVDGTGTDVSSASPFPVTVISSLVGTLVEQDDGTINANQSNVAVTIPLHYTYDPTTATWTRTSAFVFNSIDLDETPENIKTTSGTLYGYSFSNLHATLPRYLSFYNATVASTTVGVTPVLYGPIMMPAGATGHLWMGKEGPSFNTALCAAATTSFSGAGAPGANEVLLTADYK